VSGAGDIRSLTRTDGEARPLEWNWDCSFVEENAAGFVLGALEPDEQQRIVHHLLWCSSCALVIHEARKSISYLPFLSPQVQPGVSAKSRLFERIASEALVNALHSPVFSASQTLPASKASVEALAAPPARKRTTVKRSRSSRWGLALAPLSALPLVLTLALVGAYAIRADHRADSLATKNAGLSTAINLSQTAQLIPPDTLPVDQTLPFKPTGGTSEAQGELQTYKDSNRVHVRLWHMNAGSEVSVSAVAKDGSAIGLGVFSVDSDGSIDRDFDLPGPLTNYLKVEVGVPPTSQPDVISPGGDFLAALVPAEVGDTSLTDASTQP